MMFKIFFIIFIICLNLKATEKIDKKEVWEIQFLKEGVIYSDQIVDYSSIDNGWLIESIIKTSSHMTVYIIYDIDVKENMLFKKITEALAKNHLDFDLSIKVGHKYFHLKEK